MWIESSSVFVGFTSDDVLQLGIPREEEPRGVKSGYYDRSWINIDTGSVVALICRSPGQGISAYMFSVYSWTQQTGLEALSVGWADYENQWYPDDADDLESRARRLATKVANMLKVSVVPRD